MVAPSAARVAAHRFLEARDARGSAIDLGPIRPFLEAILEAWRPTEIWLFGSRARGEAESASDWDLLAVVPDDVEESRIDPLAAWRLRKQAKVRADLVACHDSEFLEARSTPNTLAYQVLHEGTRLYER